MALTLSGLYVYPVKSFGGIALTESVVQPRGLQYDRRWMLVDEQGRFVSQREHAALALLGTALEPPFLTIFRKDKPEERLQIPLVPEWTEMPELAVQIWDDHCIACLYPAGINAWFSQQVGAPVRLVYLPDTTIRPVEAKYAPDPTPVSFADAYPFLLIGQASLDDLNRRMSVPLPMNRFRPNFVVSGSLPYQEDEWRGFSLGRVRFRGVKPCARCIIPTIDQDSGLRSAEPLKTLTTYRQQGRRILFGLNVLWTGEGAAIVRVGEKAVLHDE